MNRSFGVDVGKERSDLNRQLRTDGIPLRAGVAFCANGVGYEAKLYGAGFTGNPYPFAFHHGRALQTFSAELVYMLYKCSAYNDFWLQICLV